ncbi:MULTISPECIES: protein translocase subunit SecD [Halomonadaceae]|jgi:preprotein translocase subunit SecD|uniref:Protein translocase subunit SecD n=1 Tax=Vreelandella halophila TaxID=86177 RepID=A0A9X4YD16_9GAMM|nr:MULTISPECIES: protein translocase subunit SecD [Halomonas]MYL27407.1 protein translocase subunit SecD [Halomonas utahensis]MYL74533.1 protein translocase subunit SecD [Halomonas sp. 22501_18_FS]
MLNKYPLWKNLLVSAVVLLGIIYALPNLFPDDYAVQISGSSASVSVDETLLDRAQEALDEADIDYRDPSVDDGAVMLRFDSSDAQLRARSELQEALGSEYVAALSLAATTPDWLRSIGATPMNLGLDLRGGVHFLMQVDMEAAVERRLDVYASEIKRQLREERIRYRGGDAEEGQLEFVFPSESARDDAASLVSSEYDQFRSNTRSDGEDYILELTLNQQSASEIRDYALNQNLTTLRNRVNELGVAEPLIQQQGSDRIVVQLPGVQDTAEAKRVLGSTANLEFRLEARSDASSARTETFPFRNNPNRTAELERDVIITGDNVADANQSFDENGQPQVNITLDGPGGSMMQDVTRDAVGRQLGVLFIEHSSEEVERQVDGKTVTERVRETERSIISLATIRSTLGSNFRVTGLENVAEASELALLLRAGALAAPIYFVEERTIGPSLGQQNIESGINSVILGFVLVALTMLVIYKAFGLLANVALMVNLTLLVGAMSVLGATLTLPGIAGIVLTVGMAVDANVLIFERIKEELREGLPVQSAINAGFSRAFVSIFDANVTTFLVAGILFAVGTGPVKGFAVTLLIGILTSMFTALMVSRAIVNATIGGRSDLKALSI